MGAYQWQLFTVVGFGWASDNPWPIAMSLILVPVGNEFAEKYPPLLTLSQNVGFFAGAMVWGFACDVFGRKWPFSLTLGLTAVAGPAGEGAPSFWVLGLLTAVWSFGVGGNLPVDSAIFIEFLPKSHRFLLTVLAVFWAIGQVVTTAVAWPLLGGFTCQQRTACVKRENLGWRYFLITMGGLTLVMFLARFAFFTIHESPKFLAGKGENAAAVRIMRDVTRRNGKECTMTVADLAEKSKVSTARRHIPEVFQTKRVRDLFRNRSLALSTGLIMTIWALIGLGYPLYNSFLPYIQASSGADFGDGSTYRTYRDSLIVASVGVPGTLLEGCWSGAAAGT